MEIDTSGVTDKTQIENAKKIAVIEACIKHLRDNHPYPANMKIDRKAFAAARAGYEAAIYNLEKFLEAETEE